MKLSHKKVHRSIRLSEKEASLVQHLQDKLKVTFADLFRIALQLLVFAESVLNKIKR